MPQPDLNGLKILVDCAHGAASAAAPEVLKSCGAEVKLRGCTPNGRNINDGVGSLHPPTDLEGCDLGICFDGDADRLILIDEQNGMMDGDDFLWLLRGGCSGPIVGTVMSNGGLEAALKDRLLRSQVGDRHVANLMKSSGAAIGAEPSGHILFSKGMPAGDGLYAALRILEEVGSPPFDLSGWRRWPVSKNNISFSGEKIPLSALTQVGQAQKAGQRVIVRYSGTESKLRIMVEGQDAAKWSNKISEEFQTALTER